MPVNSFDNYFLSWRPERARLQRPYYLSLASQLESDILSGRLAAGTRLPPQRELADYLDLNFTTISRVYALCEERGLLYGVVGRGTFVAPRSDSSAGKDSSSRGVIELGVVNGFDVGGDIITAAMRQVLEKGYLERLFSYAEPAGYPHQRSAAASWLRALGVPADSDHVALFPGAQNIISTSLLSLFRLGDVVATDEFTYANLMEVARLFHIRLHPVEGDSQGMLPEELERSCQRRRIHGIFLMPSCANPTTIAISAQRRQELAQVIARHGLVLIEDDIGGTINWARGEGAPIAPMYSLLPEQTVYICGAAMGLCNGLRVACAAFPAAFRQSLLNGLKALNIKTSSLDGEILTQLINSGAGEPILTRKLRLANEAGQIYGEIFPERCQRGALGAFFRWLPIYSPKSTDGRRIEQELLKSGISVCHSHRFQPVKSPGGQYLRVSISSAASMGELRRGLQMLREWLEERGW